ncbi:MAG: hypothetical protein HY648_04310 [Acidobacteria bacterium]|nr:hypothetical protein [Acidobacteriota bacterium]
MGFAKTMAHNLKGTATCELPADRAALRRKVPCLLVFFLAGFLPQPGAAAPQENGLTYAVVVTGLDGEPEFGKLIQGWSKDLYSILQKSGLPEERLFWLAAQRQEGVYSESRGEQINQLLGKLAARIQPGDVFQLFLIGHGSYDGEAYRFNIPGPDLTDSQWKELLGRIRSERQIVVNMTSSSGASLVPWRQKGRALIVSTTSGRERNFSVFPRYFVEGLQNAVSDADKNRAISALEAFQYANREVGRYYESLKRLPTEHALLEDRGEGEGVREPGPGNGEGLLAATIILRHLEGGSAAAETPEVVALRAKKRQFEEAIEQLKYRKASMSSEEYQAELGKLLLELARTEQRLDDLQEKKN